MSVVNATRAIRLRTYPRLHSAAGIRRRHLMETLLPYHRAKAPSRVAEHLNRGGRGARTATRTQRACAKHRLYLLAHRLLVRATGGRRAAHRHATPSPHLAAYLWCAGVISGGRVAATSRAQAKAWRGISHSLKQGQTLLKTKEGRRSTGAADLALACGGGMRGKLPCNAGLQRLPSFKRIRDARLQRDAHAALFTTRFTPSICHDVPFLRCNPAV